MKKTQIFWLCLFIVALFAAAVIALSTAPSKSSNSKNATYHWVCPSLGQFVVNLTFQPETIKLYGSKSRPVKKNPQNYYQGFITNDPLIKQLSQKLTNIAKALCQDDTTAFEKSRAELNISFWQSLPYSYDDTCDYPTVSLMRGSGSCFDKTLGCLAIFKEWGYGCAMLYFSKIPLPQGGYDQHVTLGLLSDDNQYFGNFTYVELSRPTQIGIVPAAQCAGLLYSQDNTDAKTSASNAKKLGPINIYLADNKGKKYQFH